MSNKYDIANNLTRYAEINWLFIDLRYFIIIIIKHYFSHLKKL